ncbi:hypothetical protein [Flavobacterium psychrophilum]|uniref:hypothetical protein n=1 Tax=Flavobacterium psychrophilum TaxID=96345 RepID=UPI000B7C1431|nr:hypothetical protein [Flavobacterium psychrophilum]MBF2024358.1 hypothetical protein [Flavobacterium psychrophilum]MCB5983190.1 hypothetical protein [Flavobacterium psychrophilum]MCB5995436.1 hypothetical protein [Flavobacterium psychrophilum]MCB5997774.1 hypothetical protein [Flavobacterium psychrophilum]MCB6005347.1 hypothetical protein [Flavobacterium psychrophilum]
MNSFFAKLFLEIQEKIKTDVPDIRFVEQNFGQYGFEDYRAMVSFPALLIDFPNTSYSALQGDIQLAAATINIVLLFEPFSQSYNIAPKAVKQKALEYYEIEHQVCKALQDWNPEFCTPLVRTDAKSQNRNEIGLRIRELNFSTEFEDWSLDNDQSVDFVISFNGSVTP